jgi:hypothetical protein
MNVGSLITAGVALLVAVGGYIQFVLRRTIFPCVEFDVELTPVSRFAANRTVGELVLSMKNVGPGTGYVTSVQCRVRYHVADEIKSIGNEPSFPGLVQGPLPPDSKNFKRILGDNAFALSLESSHPSRPAEFFIQPGVTQWHRKPLTFPSDVQLVHVWAAFAYHMQVGRIAWLLARVFTHRPEDKVVEYTVRRTFNLDMATTAAAP